MCVESPCSMLSSVVGSPAGGNDWPRLVVLSIILSLRAYNADYDDDDDIYIYSNMQRERVRP